MPRPKSSTTVSPRTFRLSEEEGILLDAVAYDLALSRDLAEATSDRNVSALIREIISRYLVAYCKKADGGREGVLKRYLDAQVREHEAELERLRGR